jgi:hypothetical protein
MTIESVHPNGRDCGRTILAATSVMAGTIPVSRGDDGPLQALAIASVALSAASAVASLVVIGLSIISLAY